MSSLRFLLVTDDSKKLEGSLSALQRANHSVLLAEDLDEAVEALSIEQFDVILIGSHYPAAAMSSFTANLRKREQDRRASSRIPVLSLVGEPGNPSKAPEGCDGVLREPLDAVALTEAVKNLAVALGPISASARAASTTDSLPVLEPDKFEQQVGFDNELMVEIIDLFLQERKAQVVEMHEFVAAGNWEELSKVAHTIKGSLSSLHATRSRARAQELEFASRASKAELSEKTFHALLRDLEMLEPKLIELKQLVASA